MVAHAAAARPVTLAERPDFSVIGEIIEPKSKVLDLGCGEGELLAWLVENKGVMARGVEISAQQVRKAIGRWGCAKSPLSSYAPRKTFIRLMFHASATSDHSAVTLDSPRSENCRNRITCLMMPNTGSTVLLRNP